MKLFRGFAVASALLAVLIAVLGSWVRINEAGLTCPDWPLCHGRLVPTLRGGVVLEWTHRLVAFLETFVVVGAIAAGFRERSRVAGVRPVLGVLAAIFAVQVLLGGATVLRGNDPLSVTVHWAMGMALLATLTALAILSLVRPAPAAVRRSGGGPATTLGVAALFAFATMCAGAYVSSSHAGLACSAFPACGAASLGTGEAQFAQILHRFAALAFACVAAAATIHAVRRGTPRARTFALFGAALLVAQIALGAFNVVLHLPAALRELHAANACATFLAFVIAALLAALDATPVTQRSPERMRARRRIASSA